MAALPGFLKDWSDIRPYFESNLLALNRLLYHFRNSDISNFIQASTSSVYGSRALGDESQGLKPISPYGVSKLAAEKLAMTYFDNYKTPIKILRYFSVYGPSQRPDMAFAKIIRCIKSNTPFEMYGDGTQMRSNTFIRDVIDATIKAEFMEVGEVINICGDEHASLNEIIQIIESLSNTKLRISKLTGRKGDQENTFGDNSKAKRILGWIPKTSLRQGLKEQFENMANL
jgi:nucleoside-diphosphate-sugar epimerase